MDINDVKALIKSILVTSTVPYSVSRLVHDFEREAGIKMPIFEFNSPKAFLKSLNDTVKFVGEPPYEKIIPVTSAKTRHISSLIKRQGKVRFHQDKYSLPDFYASENSLQATDRTKCNERPIANLSGNNKDISGGLRYEKADSDETSDDYKYFNDNKTDRPSEKHIGKDLCDKTYEDYLFKEDEINIICKRPGLDPGLRFISPSKINNYDNITDTGSLTSGNSSECYVNDGVKSKLKELMKKQTGGIWCCDLPELYKESYQFRLEFKDYGYRSLIEMVMELSDIFRYVRPGNGDWLLFDASKPPSQEEVDIRSASQCKVPEYVKNNILQLIESHCENSSKSGVYLDDLLVLYFKKFRKRLNFTEFGFPNIKSLLTKLDGYILRLEKDDYGFIIKPITEQSAVTEETAVLPITPDDDVFIELFPDNVVKRGENFAKLKIQNYFRVGKKVEVNVADVWSPDKFYVQLKEYEEEFLSLNESLQAFYNRNVNRYKMPDSTVQQNQICVALFSNGGVDEWNRSVIVRTSTPKASQVIVNFVDCGNRVKMDVKNLRFLHRDFFNLPAQAFSAKLDLINPPNGNSWPLETCEEFLQLVSVPTSEFHVKSIDPETEQISGVLISINGNHRTNVAMRLVQKKMAVCNDTQFLNEWSNKSITNKSSLQEMATNGVSLKSVKSVNKKSSEDKNAECQEKDEIFDVSDIADEKIQAHDRSKGIETISAVNPPAQNLCITNVNMTPKTPTLRLERDVYALAFWVMSTNELVKKVAQIDLDNGLQMALNLARNMSNVTEVTYVDWK